MSTAVSLRDFIIDRLTAAAADIFSVCEQTIVRYEQEIDRQRRLLEISLKPRINLTRIDFLQHDASEKATCSEPHHQDSESDRMIINNNNQEEGEEEEEPSQIKEEEEEEQQGLNPLQTPTEHENSEFSLKPENDTFIVTLISDEHEQRGRGLDSQSPPSHRLAADQSQDQSQSKRADSASTVEENDTATTTTTGQEKDDNMPDASDGEGESDLTCDVCGKTLRKVSVQRQKTTSENLRSTCDETPTEKEKKRRTDKNPHVCEICAKTFPSPQYANIHTRMHNGERPYVCTTCGKGFVQLHHRNQHEATHTSLKPFSCKTCDKQFRRLGHLFSHVRIHTSEKPFSCKTCGRKFNRQCSLRRHGRTHTGERPYSCDVCGKTYTQATHLTQHKLTHTGRKRFSCQTCAKAYFYSSDLLRHKKKSHS